MKPRIKSKIWKLRKQKIPNHNNKMKIILKIRIVKGVSGTISSTPTFASCQKEKRESNKLKIYFKK